MPNLALVSVLLLAFFQQPADPLIPTGDGAQWQCPATPVVNGSDSKVWFEGTFGQRNIRLYLDRGDTTAVAAFYATDDWKGISLGGHLFPENKFAFGIITDAETEPSTRSGLKGQFVGEKILGTWQPDAAAPAVPVELHQVPEPPCDGHGPWKSFSDRRWPIEFSYPANWHVVAGEKDLTITCPDPQGMAYMGQNIWLSKSSLKQIPMRHCEHMWVFNLEDTDPCEVPPHSASVSKAIVTTRNGITHYGGWVLEDRIYCAIGGYEGLGGGGDGDSDEVLQVGDSWLQMHSHEDPSILRRIDASMKQRP